MLARVFFVAGLVLATAAAASPSATAGARAPTEAEVGLLSSALERTAGDLRRWAYTESRVIRDEKGRVKSDVLVRYDPSKPYAEQWTPLAIDGRPPGERDRQKYRRQGERAQRRDEDSAGDRRKTLGELIELRTATVASETERQIVFEVPLRKDGNDRFPPDKFQVLVRIDKATRALENIAVRLRGAFRSKLVLKVKSGEGTLEFAAVDPRHPPTLTAIRGDASASILFVSVGGELSLRRTELKHVRPFDEKFEVQIGTLKAIDF